MAAIGAAVNELREAQSLMTPVIIPLMVPYALGIFIAQDPNSTLARVCSFIPPINPFVMMLRVASTEPPPMWEVALSLLIAAVACVGSVYFAAKVFRVGLLMHGKPPNFGTLVKWVRMA
jgi:ABC-2 type transport system permease protein